MDEHINALAILARKMMLTAEQATVLPAAIERAGASVDMTAGEMVRECMNNAPLAAYLASVCRSVAASL